MSILPLTSREHTAHALARGGQSMLIAVWQTLASIIVIYTQTCLCCSPGIVNTAGSHLQIDNYRPISLFFNLAQLPRTRSLRAFYRVVRIRDRLRLPEEFPGWRWRDSRGDVPRAWERRGVGSQEVGVVEVVGSWRNEPSALVNCLATRDVNHELSGLIFVTNLYKFMSHLNARTHLLTQSSLTIKMLTSHTSQMYG